MTVSTGEMTLILERVRQGDQVAESELFEVAFDELHQAASRLMRDERSGHTLQPSALLNEAALRLLRTHSLENMPDRSYFFGAMIQAMRRVLIEHARRRKTAKRGDMPHQVPLDVAIEVMQKDAGLDLVRLDDSMQTLAERHPRTSEIVELRFFGGMTLEDIARQLNVSLATVNREWRFARAWLREAMIDSDE